MATFKPETQRVGVPKLEFTDQGTVRLGSGCITAKLPPVRLPRPEIVDRGTVRLGSGCISATLPPLKRAVTERPSCSDSN